ncbi:UNVERIFIED_CONTAM: Proteinase inhibitor [Sesamum radiatum]|uniref:Proteinase inhibitor n=1 Tax=Sesamum radiatum TaxID=300843 RepID=A0AAW2TYL2_SESRA
MQVLIVYVGKSSWPELLGQPGDIAVATIERENPLVTAIIVPPETVVIPTFQCDRVWVYVDANGNVNRVPIIG